MSPRSSSGATTRPIIWRALGVVDPETHAAVVRAGARGVLRIAVGPVPALRRRAGGAARRAVDAVAADVLVVAAAAVDGRSVRRGVRRAGEREREGAEDGSEPPQHATHRGPTCPKSP